MGEAALKLAQSPAFKAKIKRIQYVIRTVKSNPFIPHFPQPKQLAFMSLPDMEALYGGAAGGGKSDALLMDAMLYSHVPSYTALILRQSYKDLALPDAIMDRASKWLSGTAVRFKSDTRSYVFPSGARLVFGYLRAFRDVYQYQGGAYQYIAFDELTQFQEKAYEYMFSRLRRPTIPCMNCGKPVRRTGATTWIHANVNRNRSIGRIQHGSCQSPKPSPISLKEHPPGPDGMTVFDIPLRVRSGTNPGGFGHEWVKLRFNLPQGMKARPFIPAKVDDNEYLDIDEYERSLQNVDPVTRKQLLEGDWDARTAGRFFSRMWLAGHYLDHRPRGQGVRTIRYWDLAATAPSKKNKDPDYTVGGRMSRRGDDFFLSDVRRKRLSPGKTSRLIIVTAEEDGKGVEVYIEQEPGATGKLYIDEIARRLPGHRVVAVAPAGSKMTRFGPFSSAAERGNVYLCETGRWDLTAYLDELESFDEGEHDDQVDMSSGAYHVLADTGMVTGTADLSKYRT